MTHSNQALKVKNVLSIGGCKYSIKSRLFVINECTRLRIEILTVRRTFLATQGHRLFGAVRLKKSVSIVQSSHALKIKVIIDDRLIFRPIVKWS